MGQGAITSKIANYFISQNLDFKIVTLKDDTRTLKAGLAVPEKFSPQFLSKPELTKYLDSIDQETLIVSAANRYIYPKKIISKPNLTIINYHASLLPKFPGRNSEAWTIYAGEEYGGITWHFVDENLDSGKIIVQEKVKLSDEITSFELLRIYTNLAFKSFTSFIFDLINNTNKIQPRTCNISENVIYSWQKPNEGLIPLDKTGVEISRILRAYDYGPLKILGDLKLYINNTLYIVKKYKIFKDKYFTKMNNFLYQASDDQIYIKKDDFLFFIHLSE
jgi:methionyl-tRNA formyltransferase